MRLSLIGIIVGICSGISNPLWAQSTEPAVSGWNTKFGLSHVSPSAAIFSGSLTGPVTDRVGIQFDLDLGLMERSYYAPFSTSPSSGLKPLIGTGVHLFTRDPSQYLLGVFASEHTWNTVSISRLGVEFELYRNRVTIGGVLGNASYQFSNAWWDDYSTPFGFLDFAYYPTENTKVSAAFGLEDRIGSVSIGVEKGTVYERLTATYSAYIRQTTGGETSLQVGVTLYLGPEANATLRRTHRTADPKVALPEFPELYQFFSTTTIDVQCSNCTNGTSGTCQNASTKICTAPNAVVGRCPRRYSPCTSTFTSEIVGPTWPHK